MDRNRIIELLARKMADEASPRELEELNALMAQHPDGLYYQEVLKELWLNGHEQSDSGMPDVEAAYQRHQLKFHKEFEFEAEEPVLNAFGFGKYKKVLSVAAVLLICLFAGLFFFNRQDGDAPNTEIVAGKGIRKMIKLPDGTLVWLNGDSKLSYHTDLNKKSKRIVHLTGEAFFDVAHRDKQPFIVRTSKMSVKVLGTAFNVKAYPVEKRCEATLLRGSIELSVNGNAQQKIILSPSEKFALVETKKTGQKEKTDNNISVMIEHIMPVRIGKQDYIEETSWKDNTLVFKNESFEELKPKLERWFNVEIVMETALPKSYRFTGAFKNESIQEALAAMQLIKPFHFKLQAHDVIIY